MVTTLADLPANVVTEILSRLPWTSLLAAKCVCKTFLHLASPDPYFNALYSANASQIPILQLKGYRRCMPSTRLYLPNPDADMATKKFGMENFLFQLPHCPDMSEYFLRNSCNGLLLFQKCLRKFPFSRLLVLNPVTNEYFLITSEDTETQGENIVIMISIWLGFSPGSNQYKVLQIYSYLGDNHDIDVVDAKVLEVGSSSWRAVKGGGTWSETGLSSNVRANVSLDGVIYWTDAFTRNDTIGFFDFEREEFGAIKAPKVVLDSNQNRIAYMSVGVLDACLSSIYNYFEREELDVWVLEKSGNQSNWTNKFVVSTRGYMNKRYFLLTPLQVFTNGELLLMTDAGGLACYNPKNRKTRVLPQPGPTNQYQYWTGTANFTPSFVPLKDALKVDHMAIVKNNRQMDDRKHKAPKQNEAETPPEHTKWEAQSELHTN